MFLDHIPTVVQQDGIGMEFNVSHFHTMDWLEILTISSHWKTVRFSVVDVSELLAKSPSQYYNVDF